MAGVPFNTNVLRIALNEHEEMVASVIVALYQVEIDERMIIRAIKKGQTQHFLYSVWAYNKNYEYRPQEKRVSIDSSEASVGDEVEEESDYFVFSYE